MSPTAKRALFQTPSRRSKRAKPSTVMKVPKSLQPEMKQFIASALSSSSTSYAYSTIPTDMIQGDQSANFDGAKFRMSRIRVNYDFSDALLSSAVRMSVVIPKDPSTTPNLGTSLAQWDTNAFTVLHDIILPRDPSLAAGTFDVTGPINVEMSILGTLPLRNNVYVYIHSLNNGATLRTDVSYAVWFTG